MELFGDDQDFQVSDKVTINKKFAAKYEKRKKFEDIAKAMVMSDSDSESSEDEDAQYVFSLKHTCFTSISTTNICVCICKL